MVAEIVTIQLPKLYAKQERALFSDARYGLVEASTKCGKTVGCLAWIIAEAVRTGKAGRNYWWIAPIYPQAKIAFRRMCRMLIRADPAKDFWSDNKSELTITLDNGAMLWFKGADDSDSLYGEDVYAAVIDEATRCKEDSWFAVRSTLTATRGPVRIIGNVKGRKNWAYMMARKAQAGEAGMSYAKLTAYDAVDAGVLDAEEVADAKRTLPERVFRELYLAEPSDDGGNPFGLQHIQACRTPALAPGPVANWGVDLAKYHDWVVAIGLNEQGKTCAYQRWQSNWLNTKTRLKAMLRDAPSMIDATGVGDEIVEDIRRECPMAEGFVFTQKSKQMLMENLALVVQSHECTIPETANDKPCELLPEMESFEFLVKVVDGHYRGVTYSAPAGLHDDAVCAFGLAHMSRVRVKPSRMSVFTVNDREPVGVLEGDSWNGNNCTPDSEAGWG